MYMTIKGFSEDTMTERYLILSDKWNCTLREASAMVGKRHRQVCATQLGAPTLAEFTAWLCLTEGI